MFKTLLLTIKDHIAIISFNRPDAMNSLNEQMAEDLVTLTDQIRGDQSIRAVVLKGEGQLFMAGGDIRYFYQNLKTMPKGVMEIARKVNTVVMNLMHMPKPVLASVHGSVAGIGMSFMMACDLIIAAENTKFTMAYGGLGITPDGGASFNLPRMVGLRKAMEWILLSDLFDAQTAEHYGLINWVVADNQLQERTERLAERLQHGPTQSYAHAKRLVNSALENNLATQLESEGRSFAACSATNDFKIGVTSFLNKVRPEFIGE